MKIRALKLENVRKFGGQRVTIDAIGDGVTVICEANEFGKSTFFDAVHAVIFEKYSASGKTIKSLAARAGGGVHIQLEVEIDNARYEIDKRFLAQKGASITDITRGIVIARDGEAEDWIARNVGAVDQGPAGLLWVRQGVLGLEPADSNRTERERLAGARRDLLSSVAGEIEQVTGGRTMDRILKRCQEELDTLATSAKLSPKGAWKGAVDASNALKAEFDVLDKNCKDLSAALRDRRTIEAELNQLDDPAERARRDADLRDAQAQKQAADSYAQKIAAAEQEVALSSHRRTDAERQRDDFMKALEGSKAAASTLLQAKARQQIALEALTLARKNESDLRAALAEAEKSTKQLRAEQTQAEHVGRVQSAKDEVARLEIALEHAQAHLTAATQSKARVAENPVTANVLMTLEAAISDVARLNGVVAASKVRMTPVYSGDTQLFIEGKVLPGNVMISLTNGTEITIPDIGLLRFDIPVDASSEDLNKQLAVAVAKEAEALAVCQVQSLGDARSKAQQRSADEHTAKLAEGMLHSLAPSGVDILERALNAARKTVEGAPDIQPRALAEIVFDVEQAETGEAEARGRLAVAVERMAAAREEASASETMLANAQGTYEGAEDLAGPIEGREARLESLTATATAALVDTDNKRQALAALKADAPDPTTVEANLKRANDASENSRKRREVLSERRAILTAQIQSRAEEGVEERREEVAGQMQAALARVERFEAEVEALKCLRQALETARADAREAYFEPVQEELRPLLRILHDDAAIEWETDTITPGALMRDGEIEAFETLSGGTQEQIAILTRLAFARLFARRGQHLPIILDDALVYSDDDRIVKMFTALNRVALDQQIIVFSCRQLAFATLGGDRPRITIEPA